MREDRLWIGTTLASFQSDGWTPAWKQREKRLASGDESSAEHSFSTRDGIPSGSVAFDGSRAARLRCTVDLRK